MKIMGKALDLTNQRFGSLTALYKSGNKTSSGLIIWTCQCDCGNKIDVAGPYLKSGNTKSCGCQKYKGLINYNQEQSIKNMIPIGSRFGKLIVIKDIGFKQQIKGHNRRWYLCECDCGKQKEVMGNLLKNGQVSSCGQCNMNSIGEQKIKQILDDHNICYQYDTVFPELYNETNRRLRFDFIIYNKLNELECFIEFDGRQHYDGLDTNYWGHTNETIKTIQEKDEIKNNFCKQHNYILFRIPYYDLDKITFENLFNEKYKVR